MNVKKLLSVVASSALTMSLLASCSGGSTTTTTTPAADTGATPTEETRTVVVGTVGGGEPYSLVDDNKNWTGIEAELWAEVGERTGWNIELKQVGDLASLLGELDSGRVDVAANCLAITATRLETYITADPIYADAQVIIVKPDSSYQTFEDLRGCTVGVSAGQAAQSTVEALAEDYDWDVVTYDSSSMFQDLDLGRLDSVASTVTAIEKAERGQNLEFRQLDEMLFGNNVSWYFADTDEGAALRDELNEVIAEMHKDGTISEIVTKWMYKDLTELISDEWLTSDR